MATSVDAKLLKATKFPPEFNQKVDMQKVNAEVMKKWIASKISGILGNEDDVVIELCFNLIEGARFPDIKTMQIQLTGFLDKDTASFCKELWKLCLSAQSNPQGVPKELLEAKKLELIQEKIEAEKSAEIARKRRDDEQSRERDVNTIRTRERGERGGRGGGQGLRMGDSWRGGRGGRGDDRNRDFDRGPPRRDMDRRGPRYSRSPRRRPDSRDRSFRLPPREADTYVPRGRGGPARDRRDPRDRSPSPTRSVSDSRSRSPPRRRYRSSSRSRSPPRRRRSRTRSRSPDRRTTYRGRGGRGRGRSPDRGNRRRRSPTLSDSSRSRSRPSKRRRATTDSTSRSPPPRRARRRSSSSVSNSRSKSRARSVSRTRPSISRSLSRSPVRKTADSRDISPTPDDKETDTPARKSVEDDERRLTRSNSRSTTPPRRRRRSSTRSSSRGGQVRKRRRSMERYEPASKRRRNTSSVSSARVPLKTDSNEKMDRSPSRGAEEIEKEQAAVTEELKSPQKQASELREKLLREKIKRMRKSSIESLEKGSG